MHTLLFKKRLYDTAVCIAMLLALISLVMYPGDSVSAAKDGLALCINVIIPSLFPFFVLSTLIIRLGLAQRLGKLTEPLMRPLFNVSGICASALVLGFIGGYPVGAQTVISLYDSGSCTKKEAERLLAFCNNSGPAFILGVVGAGIFGSSTAGMLLYFAHFAASICIGILFRNWGRKDTGRASAHTNTATPMERFAPVFTESVKSSFQSTISICGFVVFFTVLIKLLFKAGIIPWLAAALAALLSPFGFDAVWAERFLTGLIELSSGVWSLSGAAGEFSSSMAMAAFMLGWAGISVHCQVLSFIGGSGLSVRTYIIGKLLHGVLSAAFVLMLSRIFLRDAAVSSYLAEQISDIASIDFTTAFTASGIAIMSIVMIYLIGALFTTKKAGK